MSVRFTRLQLALVGGAALIVAAAFAANMLLTPPQRNTELRTLDEAVAIGVLDQQVLDDIRSTGTGRAMVHLDVQRILALLGDLGPTVPERLAELRKVFTENKQAILNAIGPGLTLVRDYEYIGAFVADIASEPTLLTLLQLPGVRNISVQDVSETDVPIAAAREGFQPGAGSPIFQGAGVVVGVLDTGLDEGLDPDYFAAGSIAGASDVGRDDTKKDDSKYRHGTHVASTVLLVAPQAQVYAADVFQYVDDPNDNSTALVHWGVDWVDGVNFMMTQAAMGMNVRAINLSLGSGHYEPGRCPELNDNYHFFEAYTEANIIPVVSAGNDAYAEDAEGNPTGPYIPGIGKPACSAYALSVGALTSGGCGETKNEVWVWSQASADLDVLAPGACIKAATGVLYGTSMAAPQVAGAVAVLLSAKPSASNDEIKAAIMNSGPEVFDQKSGITKRRLDIPAAIAYLLGQAPPITVPEPERAVRLGPGDVRPAGELAPASSTALPRFGIRNAGEASGIYRLEVAKPDLTLSKVAPASWFTLSPAIVTLQPGDREFVTTTVRVPGDAAPGEYAALIVPVNPATGEVIGDEAGFNAVRVVFTVSEGDPVAILVSTVSGLLLGPVGVLLVVVAALVLWLRRRPKRS